MFEFNSFQIYSDESGSARDQFQAVGALSGAKKNLENLRFDLVEILEGEDVSFIEYKKINGDKKREKVAKKFIEKAINDCHSNEFRLDILYWDNQDSRHKVKKRDEIKNLELTYYKLLRWVKELHRNISLEWEFYPDKNTAVNWKELIEIISKTNLEKVDENRKPLISILKDFSFPSIKKFAETTTSEEPLSQLIDIFTGFAPFSKKHAQPFQNWNKKKQYQNNLFSEIEQGNSSKLSKALESKFEVFNLFLENCKKRKLRVSFKKKGYLCTYNHFNPKMRINYWFYEPQGEYDKTPKKE